MQTSWHPRLQDKPLAEGDHCNTSGVDEQLVMERTVHKSLDGACEDIQTHIKDVLNRVKRSRVESPPNTQAFRL